MATYSLGNGEAVTRTSFEELKFDLGRAIGGDYSTARVMTTDLADLLQSYEILLDYVHIHAANNCELARAVIESVEGE